MRIVYAIAHLFTRCNFREINRESQEQYEMLIYYGDIMSTPCTQ
jgi:hypothetical protein